MKKDQFEHLQQLSASEFLKLKEENYELYSFYTKELRRRYTKAKKQRQLLTDKLQGYSRSIKNLKKDAVEGEKFIFNMPRKMRFKLDLLAEKEHTDVAVIIRSILEKYLSK